MKRENPKKDITVDELEIFGRGQEFNQRTIKIIKLKKGSRKVVKVRKIRNNSGFPNFRNPFA